MVDSQVNIQINQKGFVMPMEPSQKFDPNAGKYTEQKDRFLVLGYLSPSSGISILGCCPTQEAAEGFARNQVKTGQFDNAFVVQAKMACKIERL
jgi:hypothetical protein